MSGSFLLTANKAGLDSHTDGFFGREISGAADALDKLAKKLKVTALSDFISLDEGDQELMREMIEEGGGDASEIEVTPPKWFDPADGLKTARALIQRLTDDPKAVKKGAAVLSELRELEAALEAVGKKKARWRFFIDY